MSDTIETCIELSNISTGKYGEPDDVLICCASPEERCTGVVRRLHKDYKAKKVFILKYDDKDGISDSRERNLKELEERLSQVGQVSQLDIQEDRPIPVLQSIIRKIKEIAGNNTPLVSIDISTFPKWHLLTLLKYLDSTSIIGSTRFLYTEPQEYFTDLVQPLSFGMKGIFPITPFSSRNDLSKETLLVLLLGYEGERALALYEKLEPADCLLLIGKPAYRPDWDSRAEEMNRSIINLVGSAKVRKIHTKDPILIGRQLKEILSEPEFQRLNHVISPLGTKPQSLGIYAYLASNPRNASLLYAPPLRTNRKFYSKGIGSTWHLPFRKT